MESTTNTISHSCYKCSAEMIPDHMPPLRVCPECGYTCVWYDDRAAYWHNRAGVDDAAIKHRCIEAGIGMEYLAHFIECSEYVQAVKNGKSIWIDGANGTGKSVLAANIARELIKQGSEVTWIHAADAIQSERARISKGTPSEWERYCNTGVLVVDDLGKENPTSYAAELLNILAESRYQANLPTIVTTNYRGGELIDRWAAHGEESTGQAIISRWRGGSIVKHMNGNDRRLTA